MGQSGSRRIDGVRLAGRSRDIGPLGQPGSGLVGRDDLSELVVKARKGRAVYEISREELTIWTFPVKGGARITDDPGFEAEIP